jgi:hypothetical protein
MSKRHLIWWNYVVDVYGILGDLSKKNIVFWVAHQLFDLIPERNVVAWNIVIIGYLKGGRILGVC